MNKYKYPDTDACISVLDQLGIDKSSVDLDCQDWEYTIPSSIYLHKYIELYKLDNTSKQEKRVLGCFIIQSIENSLPDSIDAKSIKEYLNILNKDREIHLSEFKYWCLNEEKDEKNIWHITPYVREIYNA